MGTVSTNEFRKKLKIMVDGQPYEIIENQFVKPGKGQAFNRVRIKNLVTGRTLERTWKSGDTVEEADVTYTEMTYLSMAAKFGSSMALLSKSLGGRTRRRWLHFRSKLSRRPSLT